MATSAAHGSNFELAGVPAEYLDAFWPHVGGYLERALQYNHDGLTLADVHAAILARDMQLWVMHEGGRLTGAGVTEIYQTRHHKICRYVLLGGAGGLRWTGFHYQIKAWARERGCDRLEAYCRTGMARVCERVGFRKAYDVIIDEIGD